MNRILLIGKRAAVLTRLQAALRDIGIEADVTQDLTDAARHRLHEYSAVAFGRAVRDDVRARMKAEFRAINPGVVFVDGLAPITPLLVAQFEQALDGRREEDRCIGRITTVGCRIGFELRRAACMQVTTYRLTALYRTRTTQVMDERLEPGVHHVEFGRPLLWSKRAFAVLRADKHEVRVIAVGELPVVPRADGV